MPFQTKLSPDPCHVKLKLLPAIKLLRQGQTSKKGYAEASDFLLKTLNEDLTDEQYFMRYSISKDVVSILFAKLLFDLIEAANK